MLKITSGNHKLRKVAEYLGIPYSHVVSFDIPAGYTCAKADICRTYAHRKTGILQKVGRVTCYAAKSEAVFKDKRAANWHNYMELLAFGRDVEAIANHIMQSLRKQTEVVRIHSYGDYYSPEYFQAWCLVAERLPRVVFFGYTKHLAYALAEKPDNFSVNYSFGSLDDPDFLALDVRPAACFIGEYDNQYPFKVVCGSEETAHEDFLAIRNGETFVIGEH